MGNRIIIGCLIATAISILIAWKVTMNRKWRRVYTVFGYDAYFKISAALSREGVQYRTKTPITLNRQQNDFFQKDMTQYDIYVQREDMQLAHNAINSQ
ncbi:hypothetical protein [Peribacillus sp. SCS-155]|uniref:hypothetical protein n=1 Tax=Peribacillus sedimenti TaxID=3115297 RepID=UPI00390649E0